MTETIEVGSVNLLTDVITKDRTLPEGYDAWAIRSVHPDLRSRSGYRYPWPGNVAYAPGPIVNHRGECPSGIGDGICAATTWVGMSSSGIPAITLLLVAYRRSDILGGDASAKLRLREFLIIDVIDGARLLRELGRDADLRGADLYGADLHGANLHGADLRDADLHGADLRGADLHGADLRDADLHGADLRGADLHGADLRDADLHGADLRDADLHGADLRGADLRGADLHGADLRDADLHGADLRGADLYGADLYGAHLHGAKFGYQP